MPAVRNYSLGVSRCNRTSVVHYITAVHTYLQPHTMDFESRSSAVIIDRLIEQSTDWPENSRGFWINAEKNNELWFIRRALSAADWTTGPSEYKTIEFWNDVPGALVKNWMDRYRLILLQTYELRWGGHFSWERWERQWLMTIMKGSLRKVT